MKPAIPVITAISLLLPSLAHADDKADAILKEVHLRMRNVTTYSVTVVVEDKKEKVNMRFWMQRPDKFRLDLTQNNNTRTIGLNGGRAITFEKGKASIPLSDKNLREPIDAMVTLISANFEQIFGGIKSTSYVTQKMLDEKTVVDIIDIIGKRPGESARLYIDNNSQIQKIAGRSATSHGTIYFINPVADAPIPETTFGIK
ncbi:MAG: hypothetical protein QM758_20115 [Armatimonas sp.]